MAKNLGVVIILTDSDTSTKILLGKRKNSYKAGYFGLPGGRLGLYERLDDAAARELLEETGATALDLQCIGAIKEAQPDMNQDFVHFVLVCTQWDGDVANAEPDKCEGWEWVGIAELPDSILPGHRAALELWRKRTEDPAAPPILDI